MTISQSDHCTFCGGTGQRNEHRYDKDHPHERLINEVYRYQAWLFQAWRTIRGQTKGLQRQRKLIKRVQADNAALRADAKRMKLELSRWICVWCNHITLATGDPDTDYAALQAHTLSCKDNPLVQAQAEVAALRHKLRHYERDFVATCSLHAHVGLEAEVATLRGLLRYAQGFIPAGDKDIHSRIDAALKEKP